MTSGILYGQKLRPTTPCHKLRDQKVHLAHSLIHLFFVIPGFGIRIVFPLGQFKQKLKDSVKAVCHMSRGRLECSGNWQVEQRPPLENSSQDSRNDCGARCQTGQLKLLGDLSST